MNYYTYLAAAFAIMIWSLIVQANLNSKVKKGSSIYASSGKTANQVVEEMLHAHGITGIMIEHKAGNLTDCYSPKEGKIYLSDTTYGKSTVTAISIAAHECGHAVQDYENMFLYELRQKLVPAANISSRIGPWIVVIGMILSAYSANTRSDIGYTISTLGIVIYAISFLFYLVMLPVERNASARAYRDMKESNWVGQDQLSTAHSMLRAAGDTYAVALASSALTLMRLLLIRGNRRR